MRRLQVGGEQNLREIAAREAASGRTTDDILAEADRVLNPVTIDTISDKKKSIMERLINNPSLHGNNPETLQAILDQQKITIDELEVYEEWRDRALADRPFQ